jgi:hypothetical protein
MSIVNRVDLLGLLVRYLATELPLEAIITTTAWTLSASRSSVSD